MATKICEENSKRLWIKWNMYLTVYISKTVVYSNNVDNGYGQYIFTYLFSSDLR